MGLAHKAKQGMAPVMAVERFHAETSLASQEYNVTTPGGDPSVVHVHPATQVMEHSKDAD